MRRLLWIFLVTHAEKGRLNRAGLFEASWLESQSLTAATAKLPSLPVRQLLAVSGGRPMAASETQI